LLPGLATAWLTACSVNPQLLLADLNHEDTQHVSLDVPFFPQTAYQCGPAALATILVESGVDTAPETLSASVYLPERQGSLQIELIAATRMHGRIPFVLAADVNALLLELRANRPVLLLQNLGTRIIPVWHYAVLIGYDLARNAFLLNSGTEERVWLPAPDLLRTWEWGGQWAMVALRPGELPQSTGSADTSRYLRAVADFESVAGSDAAAIAWREANKHWPEEPGPLLALGNHAYSKGQLHDAASWYATGLQLETGNVALANNLASVLGEQGCARAGEALLRPVSEGLPSDSVWKEAVHSTLTDLAAQTKPDRDDCAAILRVKENIE
jgi:hypothetical protein